ncbi:MAG: hypothetical protein O7D30_00610 [Rickettsia endosymbiont of Ixodes persulcatus]|nr:hypothetical protein [Rickettsia endosymbiont of Ixodes persulcatus]
MKHIHERDLLKRWYEIADLLPQIAQMNIGIDYLELILTYTLIKIEKSDKMELEKMLKSRLNTEQGEKLMTSLANHWKEEGIQQGIEKGMQLGKAEGKYEVAKNMLISDSDFISKVTGLSMDEINKLKNN